MFNVLKVFSNSGSKKQLFFQVCHPHIQINDLFYRKDKSLSPKKVDLITPEHTKV